MFRSKHTVLVFLGSHRTKENLGRGRGLSLYFFVDCRSSSTTIRLFFECWLIGLFIGFFDHVNAFSDPSHDRYGHAVAQRLVTGTVRSVLLVPIWDIGVIVRESLQAFAFSWGQPADGEISLSSLSPVISVRVL